MDGDSVTIRVKAQPRARRPGLRGVLHGAVGPRLGVAVTEAAESGRAIRAICAALAARLGVARSAVSIAQGATSRAKLLRVAGDPVLLAARLQELGA